MTNIFILPPRPLPHLHPPPLLLPHHLQHRPPRRARPLPRPLGPPPHLRGPPPPQPPRHRHRSRHRDHSLSSVS